MHWFFLAALALAAAAFLWYIQVASGGRNTAAQPSAAPESEAFRQWLDRPDVQEALEQAVEVLLELMAHPRLGGPGFLTLRLPQPGEDGLVTVSAQYPNIRETMYNLVIRQELDPETLLKAGAPERLPLLSPEFETESGGVVLVSLKTGGVPPELTACLNSRKERGSALGIVAEHLGERFPEFSVRVFGTELLLSPIRGKDRDASAAAISINE